MRLIIYWVLLLSLLGGCYGYTQDPPAKRLPL